MNLFTFTLSALIGVAMSDYTDFVYGQFAYVQSQKTWTEANEYCLAIYGTTLATIKNDDDAEAMFAMKEMLKGDDTTHVWVGLTDMNNEGVWEWASGYQCDGDCDELDYWNDGEPNAFGQNEDCAHILSGSTSASKMLNDLTCGNGNVAHFICDVDVMGPRVHALEVAMGEMASGSIFVGPLRGVGEYALCGLLVSNLFVLVCLTVYCLSGRMAATKRYGKVAMYESEAERVNV